MEHGPRFIEARNRAAEIFAKTKTPQRIFRAYGLLHVRAADLPYDGEHVAFFPMDIPAELIYSTQS